jgi:transmembrane sensor
LIAAMGENTAYYETLIAKYLSSEASKDEVHRLLEWLKVSSENLDLFMKMREGWILQQKHLMEQILDIDDEWVSFSEEAGMNKKAPVTRKLWGRSPRFYLGAAAIVLLLIIPTLTYLLYFTEPTNQTLFAENVVLESTLPDGTQVALNTGSILYYPSLFKGNERKVSLDGEAFFDVTHDEEKAFVIVAENMQVKVLGTSFYVNTHTKDNTMEVILISGSVELSYNDNVMFLDPGDKAIVSKKNGEIVKEENKNPNLLAWKTRTLYFNDTPLYEIIDVLEKFYHKKITVLNPAINNCRVTATFKGQSLEAVLMVLQSTIDITARPQGNTIEISGTGCQ